MGFGFLFNKKEKKEMLELLTEDNIIMYGNPEDTNFISLEGGNKKYIYSEAFELRSEDNHKLIEELAVQNGVDRKTAKEYSEHAMFEPKIYMDNTGYIDFILEFDIDTEIDWKMTEKEKEMLIRKADEHFKDCFGVDLMKLPELVKGCMNREQLLDKFEVEKSKGTEKIIEAYGLNNMETENCKTGYGMYTVLACTFRPEPETSKELCKEAGITENSNAKCTANFDNHMQMKLEVNNGIEKNEFTPKSSLEKEIRIGISAMFQKNKGYSLAEYLFEERPETLLKDPDIRDMEYYCNEMKKQNFFSEAMPPAFFYDEERVKDWAMQLLCDFEKEYNLTPLALHREFDYYKYPDMETRYTLLKQLKDYEDFYERCEESKKNGFGNSVEEDDIEVPF